MVEIVKKEDIKGKSGSPMTLSEKKLVASADSQAKTNVDIQKTTVSATVNGAPAGVDNATNLEVAQDQDIKDMLKEMQGGGGGVSGVEGVVGTDGTVGEGTGGESVVTPMDYMIVKGILQTVYMIPPFVMKVDYEWPDYVIDMRAKQLHAIMIRYGISDIKYIDLLAFGSGVAMDMATVIRMGRDQKAVRKEKDRAMEVAKLEEERRIAEDRLRIHDAKNKLEDSKNHAVGDSKDYGDDSNRVIGDGI
jgi:hypothetical protein